MVKGESLDGTIKDSLHLDAMSEEEWLRARIEQMRSGSESVEAAREKYRLNSAMHFLALGLLGFEVIWLLGVSLAWPYTN
jgi:hypothetical protein